MTQQIGKHRPERDGALRLEVVQPELAEAVGGHNLDIIRRRNVRLAVELRSDVALPDESGAVIDIHPVLLGIGRVELHELAVNQALRVEGQTRAMDGSVLLLLDHRRAALSTLRLAVCTYYQEEPRVLGQKFVIGRLEDGAVPGFAVKHTDLARRAVARLEPEQIFDLIVHYVV